MEAGAIVRSNFSRSCTVKALALAAVPRKLVTVIRPVVARGGTTTLSRLAPPLAIAARSPLSFTVLPARLIEAGWIVALP